MITAKILLLLFATIPVGLALVWLGLRGRRINRVPNCRQCKFDLTGVWPASVTCPECGAGLKQPKMVVTGQRRRMWWLIVPAGLGVALPGLALATALFLTLAGKDVYKYKPVSMLLWEGRNASPEFAKAAAKELTDRMLEQKLTDDEVDLAVKQALELQGDVDKPWLEEWGAFIEQARLDGALSAEQKRLFRKQAAVLELVVRPRVRLGDPLPVAARVKEYRVGPKSEFQLAYQMSAVKYTADDATLPLWTEPTPGGTKKRGFFDFLDGPEAQTTMPLGYGYVAGSDSQYRQWQMAGSTVQSLHRLRPGDELGTASIAVECLSTTSQIESRGGFGSTSKLKKDDAKTKVDVWTGSFEIVAADQETVEIVPESEALKKQMLEAISISQVQWWSDPGNKSSGTINLGVTFTEVKVPLAMVVSVRTGGKETVIGEFTTSTGQAQGGYGNQKQRWLGSSLPGGVSDQVDIVLRPKKELAIRTHDLVKIYGGELVIEKVPVNKPNMSGPQSLGLLRLFGF
ncbi:MAG: hypothetical protein AABZ53_05675 [Planctomycetota bacterium]